MALLQTLKSLVNQRLSAAAEEIFVVVGRILTEYESEAFHIKQQTERRRRILDMVLQPTVKLHPADAIHLPVCKNEVFPEQHQERASSLLKEEPESLQIKEEQEEIPYSPVREEPESLQIKKEHDELHQRPEEGGVSPETLLAAKHKQDDDENIQTEPVAGSTAARCLEINASGEDRGTSQATSEDQLISSHRSEHSDITDGDGDEWDETTTDNRSGLNTLKSRGTRPPHTGGNSLSVSNEMLRDMRSPKHRRKKCFSCMDCVKTFNLKGNLKKHMLTHSGEKPFACTACGTGFSQKSNLRIHMMIHTGEKPFSCTVCGEGYRLAADLQVHMITHTGEKPFVCTVCGKGFARKAGLKMHQRSHTGERPFTCAVCGLGCTHNGQLKEHMRTHTGEKPFQCTVCKRGFNRMYGLKSHMNTHKGKIC